VDPSNYTKEKHFVKLRNVPNHTSYFYGVFFTLLG